MNLRPGQIEVAAYEGGYLAVPAVPGAGKTTCLAYLAANLLEKHPGRKVLIVTVMNSAVSNFKHKISELLSERGLPDRGYEVKTIHSLAVQILKEAPEFVMVNDAFQIIDESLQSRILKQLIRSWLDSNSGRWEAFLREDGHSPETSLVRWREKWRKKIFGIIPSIIKHIKLQGLTDEELQNIHAQLEDLKTHNKDSFLLWAFEVMREYEDRKRRDGLVDFDDMINLAYRLLVENEDVRERFQERWTYIFEDEAQDSNPLQEKILRILSERHGNLVRVGDTNQGIMRFNGTDPELFRRFCQEEDVEVRKMLVASRSTEEIMEFANSYVLWVRQHYPVKECRDALEEQLIQGVGEDDPFPNPVIGEFGISTYKCDGKIEDEISTVAEMVADFVRSNPDKTVAVLMRQNDYLVKLAGKLRHMGVEFEYVGKSREWRRDFHQVSDIWTIIRYLARPYERATFESALMVLMPQLEEEAAGALRDFLTQFQPEELLYPIGGDINWTKMPEDFPPRQLPRLQKALDRVRRWLELSYLRADELVLQLAAELGLEGDQRDMANSMSVHLTMLIREHPEYDLSDIVREFETIDAHLKYMAGVLQGAKGYSPKPGVVSLSTYHSAKGLEWDAVYAVGLAVDDFCGLLTDRNPNEFGYLQDDYKNPLALAQAQLEYMLGNSVGRGKSSVIKRAKIMTISENLRLLYVAFTRARERLTIGTHTKNRWDKDLKSSIIFDKIEELVEEKKNGC